jgi:hypothetical protein
MKSNSNSNKLKAICVVAFLCVCMFSGRAQQQKTTENKSLNYKILQNKNTTWGYDILVDGQLIVHQPSVPCMQGNEGFKTKTAAETIAKLVINKMKKGEMPPTVTINEMKKLKAL